MSRTWLLLILALLTLPVGCQRGGHPGAETNRPGESAADVPTQALAPRPTLKLFVGRHTLLAEVLSQPEEIRTGMMFRTSLDGDNAMLFVFPRPHRASFWMKNVTVPLTAAYLDPAGRILELHDLEPGNERPVASASDRVQYVIEAGRGWFERHDISPGALVRTEFGALSESFSRSGR